MLKVFICRKMKNKLIILLLVASNLFTSCSTIVWKNFTWIEKDYRSQLFNVEQRHSDYDWWYDNCTAYANPTTKKSLNVYEFLSEGPKGKIPKLIKFSETTLKGFFNLAFGDKNIESGEIDDKVVSNNGDSEQVLATVVSAVFAFTDVNKNGWVYAAGSNKSRTRLYRMGINKYLDEVEKDFWIFGMLNGEWEKFQKETDYTAFVVRRK